MRMRTAALLAALALSGCSTAELQAFSDGMRASTEANRTASNPQLELIRQRQEERRTAQGGLSPQPVATQALWTGRSQIGQSVTGAYGTHCEYTYSGKFFWRMYQGSCPSSITIQ